MNLSQCAVTSVYMLCCLLQAIVLENLLSSMKFVLNGMGLLRINLELPKNRVSEEQGKRGTG